MKIKTAELKEQALDWALAKAEGLKPTFHTIGTQTGDRVFISIDADYCTEYSPSTDGSQGGPIIERESIDVRKGNPLYFPKGNERGDYYEPLFLAGNEHGSTRLIAAMRCHVASKLGNEVDVPDVLCDNLKTSHAQKVQTPEPTRRPMRP